MVRTDMYESMLAETITIHGAGEPEVGQRRMQTTYAEGGPRCAP
jgi:hypothetical protein